MTIEDARAAEKVALTDAEVESHVCCLKPRLCRDEHFHQRDVERIVAARVAEAVDRERALHRDLVSRLGFGDNITEPMADNDTIVAWFEEQSRDASEWQEAQLWRNDCYMLGHPQDDDCRECDPHFAVDRERATWTTKVEALAVRLAAAADSAGLAHKVGSDDTHAGQRQAMLLAASEARVLLSVDGTEALNAARAEAWDEGAKKRAQYDPACSVRDLNPYRSES